MSTMEEQFAKAVSNRDIPGAILAAASVKGRSFVSPPPLPLFPSLPLPLLLFLPACPALPCAAAIIPNQEIPSDTLTGDFSYTAAFGTTSLQDPNAASPLTPDSTLWLASCTKLLASIAALQCVERGYFTLDEDVTRLLPELRAPDVLKGFDEKTGQPILVTSMSVITLRFVPTPESSFLLRRRLLLLLLVLGDRSKRRNE